MNWNDFKFIDLFAGIGGIRLGFESVGGHCVFSSEFDEDACRTYEANFGEHPSGDITKINAKDIPDFDILLGGFPCQAFSIIGKKEGFANETCGTLFFDIERILKEKRPKAFMLENVRNLTAHNHGKTFKVIREHLEALGYHVYAKVLNALDYGVPQKRERIIIVGFLDNVIFSFPDPVPENERKTLRDILETNVDKKYYVRDSIKFSRLQRIKDKNYPKPYISHENMAGSITPHPYSSALRAGASANYILINDERRPTEREMLRIQGFPDTYKIVVCYTKVKKQCGNSVAVPVIKAVAKEMIKALKMYEGDFGMTEKEEKRNEAKKALDNIIKKSRVHLYKPIQIAEILYHHRMQKDDIDLLNVENYRAKSKKWRDDICIELLGRKCTSSAKFQDNLFDANAMPPELLNELGKENIEANGIVEAYIYNCFLARHNQLENALKYCLDATKDTFDVKHLIDSFWNEPGLRRSIDKIYEIIVYALFSTLIDAMEMKIQISIPDKKIFLLKEFEDFTQKVMCIDTSKLTHIQNAHVYRVGVTNAADRGLDMYSNWGPAIQIKHLSLDPKLAENIVEGITSDKVIIVCKDAEKEVIDVIFKQLGLCSRIQSIVTENELIDWYGKALKGKYSDILGGTLLDTLCEEISNEFPSILGMPEILKNRHYEKIYDDFWKNN
nr:HaeII family restriction endonuclease [uncultured Blautia sp.]